MDRISRWVAQVKKSSLSRGENPNFMRRAWRLVLSFHIFAKFTTVFDSSKTGLCVEPKVLAKTKRSLWLLVVSSVVLLWEPIPVASLARLLVMSSGDILTSLCSLHSVLLVPDSSSKPIRVFHKSFPDYLMDNQRCTDPRFFVDSSVHHATLAAFIQRHLLRWLEVASIIGDVRGAVHSIAGVERWLLKVSTSLLCFTITEDQCSGPMFWPEFIELDMRV